MSIKLCNNSIYTSYKSSITNFIYSFIISSFPTFKYQELIKIDWEDSHFKNILESKFFFVFYQFEEEKDLGVKESNFKVITK